METERNTRLILGLIRKLILLAVPACLSAVSVSTFLYVRSLESVLDYGQQAWTALIADAVRTEPTAVAAAFILAAYCLLAAKVRRVSNSGIIVGFLLALNMVFSLAMEHSGLTEVFLPVGVWGNLILLGGFTCLCTALTELIFLLCDRKKDPRLCGPEKTHGGRMFFIALAVLAVCWVPVMLFCYPGSVMADTVNQIRSIAGLERITAANPIVSTLIFGYLYQYGLSIGNEGLGLFLSMIVQALMNGIAMALAASAVYRYTKSRGWYLAVLLFFGVLPVWQNAAQLIMKDVCHTACFLLFCLQYMRCIREPKKSLSNVILLGLCALLITYTRRATFYLGVICIAVAAVMHWKKYFVPYVICLAAVVGVFTFCNQVLYPRLNIQPEWESENYSMQFQQVALYCRIHQDEMTEEEKQIISGTLDFDTIVAEYTPMISDPVKITYHGTKSDHQAFWGLYGRMWLTHPLTMLKAVAMGTFEHMNPWYDNPILRVYISDVGDYLHVSFRQENVYDIYHYWTSWLKVPVLRLFIGTGLYMWLTLMMIGYAVRRRSLRSFLGMLPAVILFVGLFMSHVNGEIRYGYPLTASTPLVFAWVLFCTSRSERKVLPVPSGEGNSAVGQEIPPEWSAQENDGAKKTGTAARTLPMRAATESAVHRASVTTGRAQTAGQETEGNTTQEKIIPAQASSATPRASSARPAQASASTPKASSVRPAQASASMPRASSAVPVQKRSATPQVSSTRPAQATSALPAKAASVQPPQVTSAPPAEEPARQEAKGSAVVWDLLLRFIEKRIPVPGRPLVYLDILKLIAIYFVLFNHTGSRGFMYFAQHMEMPWHMLSFAFSNLDKVAVPLFFMASGALLIGREETYGKLFSHRVLRHALILLAVSFISYWVYVKGNGPFDPLDFLRRLYTNDILYPLWYMYSYLSFLMMLPFIRKLARCMREKDYIWLLASHLIMQAVAAGDYFAFRGSAYHTQYLFFFTSYSYVVYGLLGFYIEKKLKTDRLNLDTLFVLLISSVCVIGLTYVLTQWRCKMENDWSDTNAQAFLNSFIVVPTGTLFYAMKMLFTRHPVTGRPAKVLSILSSCTFGVYLFEKTWREAGEQVYQALRTPLGDFAASLVHILVSCLIGLAATFIWKIIVGTVMQRFRHKNRG